MEDLEKYLERLLQPVIAEMKIAVLRAQKDQIEELRLNNRKILEETKVSNCCSAKVENGRCTDCQEPCEEVSCE